MTRQHASILNSSYICSKKNLNNSYILLYYTHDAASTIINNNHLININ